MPSYTDEDFLRHIPDDPDVGIPTHRIADRVGCTWQTANRRLTKLAAGDVPITAVDPEAGEEISEQMEVSRLLVFTLDEEATEAAD
jgi:hypothetical protein